MMKLWTIFLGAACLLAIGTHDARAEITFLRLTGGYWQVWRMDDGGGEIRQVTRSAYDKREPRWVANDDRIIYRTHAGDLWIIDLATGEERQILKNHGIINNPAVTPDGTRLLFSRFDPRSQDQSDLWMTGLDGGQPRMLTRDRQLKFQPALSPDGTAVYYVQRDTQKENSFQIWRKDLASGEVGAVTGEVGFHLSPDISPDGKNMVYVADLDGSGFDLYIMDLENRSARLLSGGDSLEDGPRFSPDGKRVIFSSNRDGGHQIWKIGLDGTGLEKLTDDDVPSKSPDWRPGKEAPPDETDPSDNND